MSKIHLTNVNKIFRIHNKLNVILTFNFKSSDRLFILYQSVKRKGLL